jgi:hypothetical protein
MKSDPIRMSIYQQSRIQSTASGSVTQPTLRSRITPEVNNGRLEGSPLTSAMIFFSWGDLLGRTIVLQSNYEGISG